MKTFATANADELDAYFDNLPRVEAILAETRQRELNAIDAVATLECFGIVVLNLKTE